MILLGFPVLSLSQKRPGDRVELWVSHLPRNPSSLMVWAHGCVGIPRDTQETGAQALLAGGSKFDPLHCMVP